MRPALPSADFQRPFGKLMAGLAATAKRHPKNWGQRKPSSKPVKK